MMLSADHSADRNHGIVPGAVIAFAGAVYLASAVETRSVQMLVSGTSTLVAGEGERSVVVASSVGFKAEQMGDPIVGVFVDHEILLSLDVSNIDSASLSAKVLTASVNTGDGQIDGTVVTADWFAADEYPEATFNSTGFESAGDNSYQVTGDLTIRAISLPVTFMMDLSNGIATGELTIDRRQFEVGVGGQDEFVGPDVSIRFEVTNLKP